MGEAAVFLDRDGTICEHVPYLDDTAEFALRSGVGTGVNTLNRRGIPVVVVTNQSGVGRGYFTMDTVEDIHEKMATELARSNAHVDEIYVCPHAPDDDCDCRKPNTGLLEDARSELGVDLESSFLVGDRQSDIEAGNRVGSTTILLPSAESSRDDSKGRADYRVATFEEAVGIILDLHER